MTGDQINLLIAIVTTIVAVGGAGKWLLYQIHHGDEAVEGKVSSLDIKIGAGQARADMEIATLREEIGREFLRIREFETSQRNTERRLESIETKVDKIPDSLDRQTARLIAAFKNGDGQ